MVVTVAPCAWTASTLQLFTALPSISTVQAPHWAVSQPMWVPVSARLPRRKSTSRVRDGTSAETALPFTVRATEIFIDGSSSKGKIDGKMLGFCYADSTPNRKINGVRLQFPKTL